MAENQSIPILNRESSGTECLLSLDPEARPTVIGWLKKGFTAAFYQNIAMDSSDAGRIAVLKTGKGCTFEEAPSRYPDGTVLGPGWKYTLQKQLFYSNPDDIPEL